MTSQCTTASASGEEHSLLMTWCPGSVLPALCVGHLLFQQQRKPPSVLCLNCDHLSLGESNASGCSQNGLGGSTGGDQQEGDVFPSPVCQGGSTVYFPSACREWRALEIKHRSPQSPWWKCGSTGSCRKPRWARYRHRAGLEPAAPAGPAPRTWPGVLGAGWPRRSRARRRR